MSALKSTAMLLCDTLKAIIIWMCLFVNGNNAIHDDTFQENELNEYHMHDNADINIDV